MAQLDTVVHFYRAPGASPDVRALPFLRDVDIAAEYCFNVALAKPLSDVQKARLRWLLSETFDEGPGTGFGHASFLGAAAAGAGEEGAFLVEVGPRLSFESAFSANAVAICRRCGVPVRRVERSRRFLLRGAAAAALAPEQRAAFVAAVHDRMTECVYDAPLATFATGTAPAPVRSVPLLADGRPALERLNAEMGLSFDDWDLDYYTAMFRDKMGRDPTDVECFDMAQSNSEHSRHWFFGGEQVIDGEAMPHSLFQLVKQTLVNKANSVIAFHDNSSAITGHRVTTIVPDAGEGGGTAAARFVEREPTLHHLLTCETHNFPCAVAPFPGAETGTGGRLRDVQACGRGALCIAGTSSYCVGNLRIPGYEHRLPWEDAAFAYPDNFAPPLQIEVDASNGASDYGNKYGEPVVAGFTRSFGMRLPNGERREWVKPIMMSAGIGQLDARHTAKGAPERGMWVVKVGGPAYRIGMGGGAASSRVSDKASASLDFNAVQRGDAEMENKMNRVIRACAELGDGNPIVSIHDQGAGGNGNVLKEIVEPAGARLEVRRLVVGDDTMSVLEIWGAEYQENNALLLRPEHEAVFRAICARENMPCAFLGQVTGDGRVILHDERHDGEAAAAAVPLLQARVEPGDGRRQAVLRRSGLIPPGRRYGRRREFRAKGGRVRALLRAAGAVQARSPS